MPSPTVRRHLLQGLGLLMLACVLVLPLPLRAQPVELQQLQAARSEGTLVIEFAVRLALPRAVEEALHNGVPIYFVAQAELKRSRWYWRDQRIARVQRSWRIAFQPLTSNWRVGLGGLYQSYPTLSEALLAVSRSAGWKVADLAQMDADNSHYIDFSYRLDTAQLPSPMQIGLGGQADWAISVERTLPIERDL